MKRKRILALVLGVLLTLPCFAAAAEVELLSGGGSSVIYVDGLEVFVAVGGDGYYTSTDGEMWALRKKGVMGGVQTQGVRNAVAYGGPAGVQKAILCAEPNAGSVHYTNADLTYAGRAQTVDAEGKEITISAIVWDSFTGKFWAGGNRLEAGTILEAGRIYVSDGVVADGKMSWQPIEIGAADIYQGEEITDLNYAQYTWVNTNGQGDFVFGGWIDAAVANAKTKCGIVMTDAALETITGKHIQLAKGTVIGDPTFGEGDFTMKAACSFNHARVDGHGNLIISPSAKGGNSNKWERMLTCDYKAEQPTLSFLSMGGKLFSSSPFGYILAGDGYVIGAPLKGPTRAESGWKKASSQLFIFPYLEDQVGSGAGKAFMDQYEYGAALLGTDTLHYVTCMAAGNNRLVITQTSADGTGGIIAIETKPNAGIPELVRFSAVKNYDSATGDIIADVSNIDPRVPESLQLQAVVMDSYQEVQTEETLTWEKVEGDDTISITPGGLLVIQEGAVTPVLHIKVKASSANQPSVFRILDIKIDYIVFQTDVTLENGTAKIHLQYRNLSTKEFQTYLVFCLYDENKCVSVAVWNNEVSPSAENSEDVLYPLPDVAYTHAKAYVIDAASMTDIQQ